MSMYVSLKPTNMQLASSTSHERTLGAALAEQKTSTSTGLCRFPSHKTPRQVWTMVDPAINADPSGRLPSANADSRVMPDRECSKTRPNEERREWRSIRVAGADDELPRRSVGEALGASAAAPSAASASEASVKKRLELSAKLYTAIYTPANEWLP